MKKVAVITGASNGIGKAVADALTLENYSVVNADIKPSKDQQQSEFVQCDISKAEDIAQLYSYVIDEFGIPDVLVSNAGQGIHEKLSEGDPEKWKKIIDINLMGTLRFIRAFLPEMINRKKGEVFFLSSIAAKRPYEYGGVYSATKAAVEMIAKTLQMEAQELLRVFIISPGVVNTTFFKNMIGSNHGVDDIGLGSIQPEELANILVSLLKLPSSVQVPEITLTPPRQV